ncbi:hypothetical protein KGP36_02375 [Patescibacteria group bacterium]|nr:hypothetical protein [Patescibacteria group bacterium]
MELDSREKWLKKAVDGMRPMFKAAGAEIPTGLQILVSWPLSKGRGVQGEYYHAGWAADGKTPYITVTPTLADAAETLSVLVHEVCHACLPKGTKHKKAFAELAAGVGLEKPWPATTAGEVLKVKLAELAKKLGPFPHTAMLRHDPTKEEKPKAKAQMKLGCECSEGLAVWMTPRQAEDFGVPYCPQCKKPMVEVDR